MLLLINIYLVFFLLLLFATGVHKTCGYKVTFKEQLVDKEENYEKTKGSTFRSANEDAGEEDAEEE